MKNKSFGNNDETTDNVVVSDENAEIMVASEEDSEDSMDEMQKVARTINAIKKQNPIQALLSGSKNERALAENDALISSVIKNILNWLAAITSAEIIRKEEYDALTNQMLQLDEDINEQLEMQVKFKKAYQSMMQKQEEQKALTEKVEKLQRENRFLKIASGVAFGIGCIALVIALI